MKTFSQFHNEINGYQDVKTTVEAEEKIAVVGIRQLIEEGQYLSSHNQLLESIFQRFLSFTDYQFFDDSNSQQQNRKRQMLIILGGNKGLVGGLWNQLVDYSADQLNHYQKIIIYGQKISQKINENFSYNHRNNLSFSSLPLPSLSNWPIFHNDLNQLLNQREFQIDIIWPKMITLSRFQPTIKKIVPIKMKSNPISKNNKINPSDGWPIFNPNPRKIFHQLLTQYFLNTTYQIFIETKLAEALSRATAMEKAKEEVNKLIKKLTHKFLTERRRALTKNQIEVFVAHQVTRKNSYA